MLIPLSAKAFAEFVVGGPSKKSQIVRNILKPKSKEAQIIAHYYAPAVNIIRVYHAKGNDGDYLKDALHNLEMKREKATSKQTRAKIANNIRAITGYVDLYGTKKRKVVPRPRIYYTSGQVRLSASPDLAVEENGGIKLLKLGVTKDGDKPEVVRIMLRVIYQAAKTRFKLASQDVVYLDIANGERTHSSHEDAGLAATIDNGCNALMEMC